MAPSSGCNDVRVVLWGVLTTLAAVSSSVTVGVDADDPELAAAVEARMVEEGLVVVSKTSDPDVTVSATTTGTTTVIVAATIGQRSERRVDVSTGARWAIRLEIVQKVASAVRALVDDAAAEPGPGRPRLEAPDAPVASSDPPRLSPSARAAQSAPAAQAAPRTRDGAPFELAVAFDGQWRPGALDPRARLEGWRLVSGPWAVGASAALALPSNDELSVVEWRLLLGGRYRLVGAVEEGFGVDVGLLVGVEVHHFSRPPLAGVRPAGVATVPVRLRYRFRGFEVAARVAPGLATRSLRHEADGQQIWARGAAQVDVGLSLAWLFGADS